MLLMWSPQGSWSGGTTSLISCSSLFWAAGFRDRLKITHSMLLAVCTHSKRENLGREAKSRRHLVKEVLRSFLWGGAEEGFCFLKGLHLPYIYFPLWTTITAGIICLRGWTGCMKHALVKKTLKVQVMFTYVSTVHRKEKIKWITS